MNDAIPDRPAEPAATFRPERLPLHGERPCLDFANTRVWRLRDRPIETLTTYDDLLRWGRHAGVLGEAETAALLVRASADEAAAARTLARAVDLREAIQGAFEAVGHGRAAPPSDLATIDRVLAEGMARARLRPTADGFAWDWPPEEDALERPLWMLARSAADLLVSPELGRVRQCPGDGCGWLFLDTSKNGKRRWCDMAVCGNRARVRAHYRRRKGTTVDQPEAAGGPAGT
ncbi:MAG: ABATE domain-containing protein [Chloroflexota bacterium]|nr:ABATE domain-containing protein [Chloroflexota bacterium]